jgi:hypothetical protein
MNIAPAVLIETLPAVNDAQRAIVGYLDGPLPVIVGPGCGKSNSNVFRTLNLMLLDVRPWAKVSQSLEAAQTLTRGKAIYHKQ